MTEKNRKLNVLVSGNILQNQLQKCQMVLPTLPDDVDLDEVDKELPWLTSQKKSWSLLLEPSEVSRVFGQLEQPLKVKKITKPIVQSLLQRQNGGSEKLRKRAIQDLVNKKWKNQKGREELVHLITAINTNGTQPTKCVTLLKGHYGSSQRNELYAKIWRWPDLKKNELRKAEECNFAS